MNKELKEKFEAAGSFKNLLIWRKIYNGACKVCTQKMVLTAIQNKRRSPDKYKDPTAEFCPACKKKTEKIIAKAVE